MNTTHTVLLVDDEPEILESLRRTLRNEPYTVVSTTSPLEALSRVEAGGVDLLIADIDMPEMTGIELVARVRQAFPEVVRILLTGDASLESALLAINQGEVHRYLTKPWQSAELRRTLREALGRLDELRKGALAGRREQVEQLLRAELAEQHPGILTEVGSDGVHVIDAHRLRAILLQVGVGLAGLASAAAGATREYDATTREDPGP